MLLAKNIEKCIQIGSFHVLIHRTDTTVPVMPQGDVQYTANVQILDKTDSSKGNAEPECEKLISRLFPKIK